MKAPAANETRDVTLTADDHEAVFTGPTAAEGTVTRRVKLKVNTGTRAKADIPTSSGWAHENNSSDRNIDIEDCGGSSGPDNVTIGYHGSPTGDSGYNFVTTIEGDITYCSGAAGVGPGEPAINEFTLLITDEDAIHIDPDPAYVALSTDEEDHWIELQGIQWRNGDPDNSTVSVTVDWSNVADVDFAQTEDGTVLTEDDFPYQATSIWAKSSVAGQYTVNATMPGGEDNAAEGTLNVNHVNMTAFRPQTEGPGYGNPFAKTAVPEEDEEELGAGIRVNGDTEDDSDENDLIEVELEIDPYPVPDGLIYVLKRENSNIVVWGNRQCQRRDESGIKQPV